MTDYPEDVMKVAREVAFNVCAQVAVSHEIIARAILAERERCAAESASHRRLLAEAGKALEPFARLGSALDEDCPRPKSGIVSFPLLDNRRFSEQHIEHLMAARTVATKIEEIEE